jgi:anti-sigma B factor antagonist
MFNVEVAKISDTAICLPKGDLDATTVSTFRGAVSLCLGQPGLIVDLSGVNFLDSAGLTALVGIVRRAREQPTDVAVVVPPGNLRKVLGEAGLQQIVRLPESVDLALTEIWTRTNDGVVARHSEAMETPQR